MIQDVFILYSNWIIGTGWPFVASGALNSSNILVKSIFPHFEVVVMSVVHMQGGISDVGYGIMPYIYHTHVCWRLLIVRASIHPTNFCLVDLIRWWLWCCIFADDPLGAFQSRHKEILMKQHNLKNISIAYFYVRFCGLWLKELDQKRAYLIFILCQYLIAHFSDFYDYFS